VTIEAIMTRDVITVTPAAGIHTAAQLMIDHGVSGLPVVDDEGRLVGIISEGDVGQVMTRSVISLSPVWGIEVAAAIMQNRRIGRLPVVRDGQLVGIVTRGPISSRR
jgi:CBS domain-containing protein